MTHEEYVQWLDGVVANGGMTAAERDDLLEQKALFDKEADSNRAQHKRMVVGYVAGEKLVGSISQVLAEAKKRHAGRMTYFEEM